MCPFSPQPRGAICLYWAFPSDDFSMYEDQGDSYRYEQGAHADVPIHWNDAARTLERFHNSRALLEIVKGGVFLGKMPLEVGGFGVQQLWNRCNHRDSGGKLRGQRRRATTHVVLVAAGHGIGAEATPIPDKIIRSDGTKTPVRF